MIIHAENLTKIYRKKLPIKEYFRPSKGRPSHNGKTAIDHVSFSIGKGEAVACIGENGAGKSTLVKMLIGILTPTEGRVEALGMNPAKNRRAFLKRIGIVFGQRTNLWWDIPVEQSYHIAKDIYDIDEDAFHRNMEMLSSLLHLNELFPIPARKLSLGQRVRADLGLVMLHNPEILFLDEPTIGLDVNIKHTIRKLIKTMNLEKDVTIFLTSHDLDDVQEICDRALVLSKGGLFFDGALDELIRKYANMKVLRVKGPCRIPLPTSLQLDIETIGIETFITFDERVLAPAKLIGLVTDSFKVENITVQEMEIERIISRIFAEAK